MSNEIEMERARISAILGHDHAKALPALANALATATDLTAEAAVAVMASAMRDRDTALFARDEETKELRRNFAKPRGDGRGLGFCESTETKNTSADHGWGKHVASANRKVGGDGSYHDPNDKGWGKHVAHANRASPDRSVG